jgi:hypothetical protein
MIGIVVLLYISTEKVGADCDASEVMQISARAPILLTEVLLGFPQSLQVNVVIIS